MSADIEKIPSPKAPWPPLAENDELFRYPKPYPLGKDKTKKENILSIANANAVTAADLIRYNFRTKDQKEINWYLANYVGCTELSKDRRSYTFENVVADPPKNRGLVFIPSYGDSVRDHANRIGERVVENYNKSNNKEPGGKCHRTCYARVEEASRQGGGPALPKVNWDEKPLKDPFAILWSSHIGAGKAWFDLPEKYRGKGAAGAMAWKGWGTLVEMADIWTGKLKPGAVIQTWVDASDHDTVRDGKASKDLGHSFIFLNYVKTKSSITGMVIADQGYQSGMVLRKDEYGYWVGANINTGAAKVP